MRDKQMPKEVCRCGLRRRVEAAHIAGARRFVGSKTRGRFGVVVRGQRGSRACLGESLGAAGAADPCTKKENTGTDTCAVQSVQRSAEAVITRLDEKKLVIGSGGTYGTTGL